MQLESARVVRLQRGGFLFTALEPIELACSAHAVAACALGG